MSRSNTEDDESRITTDRETIRGWVGEHDAVPVRYAGVEGESGTLRIVPESDIEESHERMEWDEFHEEVERNDYVVVYHGTDHPEPFEVTGRETVIGRSRIDDEEVAEALVEGETVTSEIRETTVIERTIVEEATVESELVDREFLSEEVVDVELLTRDVMECGLVEGDAAFERFDTGRHEHLESGYRETMDPALDVEVVVDEGWTVTKEVVEQPIIESRVVDTEATETDTVEADTVESDIDIAGVHERIIESDLIDADADVEVLESSSVESEFREGDVVETRLLERKTVDEEVSVRRRFTGTLTDVETLEADAVRREVVESELVGEDEEIEGATVGAGAEYGEETVSVGDVGDESVMPSDDDEGKTVVDATGAEVGMVTDVEGDILYVDPHPSIADRIKTTLGWGEPDEDDYTISPDRIARITRDQVELVSVEPEMEDEDDSGAL